MDLANNFLPHDLHKATNETICIVNCQFMYQMALHESDYKKARIASENITRSLKELERMHDDKRHQDGLIRLFNDLGINEKHLERWGM